MASRAQAIEKYNQGKIRSALNIAKNFKLNVTQEERDIMALGYECEVHPEFYAQVGKDIEAAKAEALVVLKRVLGIKDPEPEEEFEEDKVTWLLALKGKNNRVYTFVVKTEDIQAEIKKSRETLGLTFVCTLNLKKAKRYLGGNAYGMNGVIANLNRAGIEDAHEFIQNWMTVAKGDQKAA